MAFFLSRAGMLINHLRNAVRAIAHHRLYSAVNLFGLTIGLCSCMLVATVVVDDLSYDRQWSKSANLYRIVTVNKMGGGVFERYASSFAGLGPELKKNFPEVSSVGAITNLSFRLKFGDEPNGSLIQSIRADTTIWGLLDLAIVAGNPRSYTAGINNLVISESIRDRFFHGRNPVGQKVVEVSAYALKPVEFLITGVIKDLPANTHLRAQVIQIQQPSLEPLSAKLNGSYSTHYVLIRPGTDMRSLSAKVNRWYDEFTGNTGRYEFEFQPMKDIYLHSDFASSQAVKGNIRNIYIFIGVAVLLLLIACINFINLSTARIVSRLHEMGMRKILGAGRKDIVFQFLTESMVYFLLSTVLAILLYGIALRPVEFYLGHSLEQTFMSRISLFGFACLVILLVSLVTGIYPSWLLSGTSVGGALGGNAAHKNPRGESWLRKSLVVIQFAISIFVILGMIVVQWQVKFMEKADMGFDRKGLLSIGQIDWDGKAEVFKSEMLRVPGVERCSITSFTPSDGSHSMTRDEDDPAHPGNKIKVNYIFGDIDMAGTLGLRLHSGRFLDPALGTDAWVNDFSPKMKQQPSLITVSTAKILQIQDLTVLPNDIYTLPVGIVEDFHSESMRQPLTPTFIIAERSPQFGGMLVRVKPGSERQVIGAVERLWKEINPGKLLETNWVDEMLSRQYAQESKLGQLLAFFSVLAIVLAALGVFGLIVHAAGQRRKEIGVRRVLGASVGSIVRLLSSDFAKLVAVSIVIASPLAWVVMNKWLEDFAYRIVIQWWMFGVAGAVALVIALGTISFQAIKSALANPVQSLRSE